MAWADIEALLNLAEEGREAPQTKNSYGVTVSVAQSNAGLYDKGVCTLSNALKPATLASYFVHEMVHALNDKGGWTSDPLTLDQDEYVLEMVSESHATTRQYQFFVTLDVAGKLTALSPVGRAPRMTNTAAPTMSASSVRAAPPPTGPSSALQGSSTPIASGHLRQRPRFGRRHLQLSRVLRPPGRRRVRPAKCRPPPDGGFGRSGVAPRK